MESKRKVWITGAGRGIGREIALQFAERRDTLFLTARSELQLTSVANECRAIGADAEVVCADVTDAASVSSAYSSIAKISGGVDVVVANAGCGSFAPVVETGDEPWAEMISTNLTGTFLTCRTALPSMIAAKSGKLIIIASIAARVPFPGAAAYCAAKAGVVAFANAMREELRTSGVQVGVVVPGAVASTFWESVDGDWDLSRMLPPARVAEAVVRMALEPADGTTEEVTLLPPEGIL